jgi:hypothetical protein
VVHDEKKSSSNHHLWVVCTSFKVCGIVPVYYRDRLFPGIVVPFWYVRIRIIIENGFLKKPYQSSVETKRVSNRAGRCQWMLMHEA